MTCSAWAMHAIGDVCDLMYGKIIAKDRLRTTGYPVWSGYSVVGYHTTYMFEAPVVTITCRGVGGTGDIHLTPPNCWVTNLAIVVQPKDPNLLNTYYLYWAMQASDRRRLITGSAQSQITIRHLQSHRIAVPPLGEQRAIAHILGALDDKIALNQRMNATLEALARTIFTSWCVDCYPVRAKAAGCQPQGMDGALDELPRGWRIGSLDQIATYQNGLTLQKFPPAGEAYLPVIKIAQMRKGDTQGSDRASVALDPAYVVEDGDVLFSWSGSLEVVLWCGGRGALNQHLFKVTSTHYPKWFYYLWTKHHLPRLRDIAASKATTMGHIQRRHLGEARVLIPPGELLSAMDAVIAPLIETIIANRRQSRTLAAIRDALLPKLLSGAVRVREAEQMLVEVAPSSPIGCF